MMTLSERCLRLSYLDRLNLCESLKNSILRERNERRMGRDTDLSRGGVLLGYMTEILGEPIPVKSRESRHVWARAMVVYQLTEEGFTTGETGGMVGKNHSTITHLKHKMRDALDYPFAYRDIIHIWKQFQNRLENEIHKGTTNNLISLGDSFPYCGIRTMDKESGQGGTPGDL